MDRHHVPGYLAVPTQLHIDGQARAASDGGVLHVGDPADGSPLAAVSSASVEDALAAVEAAHLAGPGWAGTAPRDRAEALRRAFDIMGDESELLAELIVRENGKTLHDARGEVAYAAEFFRWYSEEAVRIDGQLLTSPGGGGRILEVRQPIGVSVLVTPWNFPAAMATRKIAPALAAGCSVVLKPAAETPLTALVVADILRRAGVPPGVVNVVPAADPGVVVSAMLEDHRVRKLSFTGSTPVGKILLGQAAERVLATSMELGGNAPFIVFDDADVDAAVAGAVIAKMRNGGASCIAANRFLVHASVVDDFTVRLVEALKSLRAGPGLDPKTDVGPVVSSRERDGLAAIVERAIDEGAKAVLGGRPLDRAGWFYPPTVLVDIEPGHAILDREVFGPIAPIVSFETEDEALKLANDTSYGLAAYVYSKDLSRGLAVAEAVESGMVGINRGFISDPAAAFGGVKESGLGREGGHHGLLEFCETKYIAAGW